MSQVHLNHGDSPSYSDGNNSSDSHHLRRVIKVRMIVFAFLQALFELVKKKSDAELENTSTALRSHSRVHPAASRSLQLKFLQEVPGEVFTGECIVAKGGGTLEVALVDGSTGDLVRYGPGTSGKIEFFAVEENFDTNKENWSSEDFNRKIVVGEYGRKSLLGKSAYSKMKEGNAPVCGIKFKHTRKWMKKGKFRLGARFVDQFNSPRIREAVSEPFIVKDRRGRTKKHYPPSPTDEVWRLKNISKEGSFHKYLVENNILTVEDFLIEFVKNYERLRKILGNMPNDKWKATSDHAQTCQLNTIMYSYNVASCLSLPCLSSSTNDLAAPSAAFGNSKLQHDKNNDSVINLTSQPDDLSQHLHRQLRIFDSGNQQSHGSELSPAADIQSHEFASLNAFSQSDTDGFSQVLSLDDIFAMCDQQNAPSNLEDAHSVESYSDWINELQHGGTSAPDIHSLLSLSDAGPTSPTLHQMQHNEGMNSFQNLVPDIGNLIHDTKEHLQSVSLKNTCQNYQHELDIDQPSAGVTTNSLGVAGNPKRSKGWAKMSSLVRWFTLKKVIALKRLHVAKKRRLC